MLEKSSLYQFVNPFMCENCAQIVFLPRLIPTPAANCTHPHLPTHILPIPNGQFNSFLCQLKGTMSQEYYKIEYLHFKERLWHMRRTFKLFCFLFVSAESLSIAGLDPAKYKSVFWIRDILVRIRIR